MGVKRARRALLSPYCFSNKNAAESGVFIDSARNYPHRSISNSHLPAPGFEPQAHVSAAPCPPAEGIRNASIHRSGDERSRDARHAASVAARERGPRAHALPSYADRKRDRRQSAAGSQRNGPNLVGAAGLQAKLKERERAQALRPPASRFRPPGPCGCGWTCACGPPGAARWAAGWRRCRWPSSREPMPGSLCAPCGS